MVDANDFVRFAQPDVHHLRRIIFNKRKSRRMINRAGIAEIRYRRRNFAVFEFAEYSRYISSIPAHLYFIFRWYDRIGGRRQFSFFVGISGPL